MCDLRAPRKRSRVQSSAYLCSGRPACTAMQPAGPGRYSHALCLEVQPRPLAGRKHAAKRLDAELKNLKRVFTLLDVGRDGVVTSEDIFAITGGGRGKGSGLGRAFAFAYAALACSRHLPTCPPPHLPTLHLASSPLRVQASSAAS